MLSIAPLRLFLIQASHFFLWRSTIMAIQTGCSDRFRVPAIAMLPRAMNVDPAMSQHPNAPANVYVRYTGPQMDQILSNGKIEGRQHSLAIVGHRGSGKNTVIMNGETPNARPSIMENTIKSLVLAAEDGVDFVEFDVQVTKDGHAVIFHDDYIIIDDKGLHRARQIRDLTLEEYLSLGFQAEGLEIQKPLVRKAKDGSICRWIAQVEDRLCTLKDAFENVPLFVGFNIELKFSDEDYVAKAYLQRVICTVLKEVEVHGKGRKVLFSSFHPDAVDLLRQVQFEYPVLFLTEGGTHIHNDERRNSIERAIEVCLRSGLQGIVCEVKAIVQNPNLVSKIKDVGLCLLTYGELNNYAEALLKQEKLGVDGVIVDEVMEMVAALRDTTLSSTATLTSNDIPSIEIALMLRAVV